LKCGAARLSMHLFMSTKSMDSNICHHRHFMKYPLTFV
jgi:hypothetical protein